MFVVKYIDVLSHVIGSSLTLFPTKHLRLQHCKASLALRRSSGSVTRSPHRKLVMTGSSQMFHLISRISHQQTSQESTVGVLPAASRLLESLPIPDQRNCRTSDTKHVKYKLLQVAERKQYRSHISLTSWLVCLENTWSLREAFVETSGALGSRRASQSKQTRLQRCLLEHTKPTSCGKFNCPKDLLCACVCVRVYVKLYVYTILISLQQTNSFLFLSSVSLQMRRYIAPWKAITQSQNHANHVRISLLPIPTFAFKAFWAASPAYHWDQCDGTIM